MIGDGFHAECEHLDGLFGQVVELLLDLPDPPILFPQVGVGARENRELATLEQVGQPADLLHELLQVKGPLLQKFDVLALTEKASLGELWDVQAGQPLAETLPERLKFVEATLDLKITLRIKRSDGE